MGRLHEVVLATTNPGKLAEMRAALEPASLDVVSQQRFDLPEADETGLSFVENAIIKARHAAERTGRAAIADDSGLAVDALDGRPGIRSARYAGVGASDRENNDKLLGKLAEVPEGRRDAKFICVIAMLRRYDDPEPLICQGVWQGCILREPRGENGFGYDPLFYVPTHRCASAELPPDVKNTISHRAQAMQQLVSQLAPPR